MNTVGAKYAELALVVAAEVYQATATFAGAREGHLMDRSHTLAIFIFKQYDRLAGHGSREPKVGELDDLAACRWLRGGKFGLGIHSTIEAEAMYPLK
jgi:hypothetical protein